MPLIDCNSGVNGDGDVDGEDLHLGSTACCQVSSSVSKVPPSPLDYFRLLQVCVWVCMWIWLVGWCMMQEMKLLDTLSNLSSFLWTPDLDKKNDGMDDAGGYILV